MPLSIPSAISSRRSNCAAVLPGRHQAIAVKMAAKNWAMEGKLFRVETGFLSAAKLQGTLKFDFQQFKRRRLGHIAGIAQ